MQQPRNSYHIVIDNSNIFIGAQTITKDDGTTKYDPTIRVIVEKLFVAIKKGKFDVLIKSKIVGGGYKKGIDPTRFVKAWTSLQFRTMFVEITDRVFLFSSFSIFNLIFFYFSKEALVDNALCGEALQLITHNRSDHRDKQVLVLATGDGNSNGGQLSFKRLVESALLQNWDVELWSWKNCLHQSYLDFQQSHPNQFTIQYLDPLRNQITFTQKN